MSLRQAWEIFVRIGDFGHHTSCVVHTGRNCDHSPPTLRHLEPAERPFAGGEFVGFDSQPL